MKLCQACRQSCAAHVIDDGVGYTEVGSAGHYDTRLRVVSDCCDAEFAEW